MPEEKPEENQEEKRRTHLIVDGETGNLVVSREQEKDRPTLEAKWKEYHKEFIKEKKQAQAELNARVIGRPEGGPWISGHQLLEKGLQGFQLFDCWFHGLQPYDARTGQEVHFIDGMPTLEHWHGDKEYTSEMKEEVIGKLVSSVYRESDLLQFSEVAAIMNLNSDAPLKVIAKIRKEEAIQPDDGFRSKEDTRGENYFIREGGSWNICFHNKHFHVDDSRGMTYIHFLLGQPNKPVRSLELSQMGKSLSSNSTDYQKMTDEQLSEYGLGKGRSSIKTGLHDLEEEMKETQNPERRAVIQEEIEFLSKQGGFSQSDGDTSNKAVRMAIKRAIDQIKEHHSSLADYLNRTIKTGADCLYHPLIEMPIDWAL